MVITKHAKIRALERLMHTSLTGATDDEKLSNREQSRMIEEFLQKSVRTSNAFKLEGVKYLSQIDGFDSHRAVIRVSDGEHILISVIPIN